MIKASIICLAMVSLFEAGGESVKEQKAVIHTTLNRTLERQGQITVNNVCDEVWKPNQYKWTKNRKLYKKPATLGYLNSKQFLTSYKIPASSHKKWNESLALAIQEYRVHRNNVDVVAGATYFHSSENYQDWTANLVFVKEVGPFKFYKDKKRKG
jgi:spore germination cell wall hydrolase CwlJ-like protein